MATRKKKVVAKGKKATAKPKTKKQAAPRKRTPTKRRPPMHAVVDPVTFADEGSDGNDETFEVFKSFDRDGSGSIDRGEFARLLEALGQAIGEEELEIALDAVDSNRSGRISWAEFKSWWSDR